MSETDEARNGRRPCIAHQEWPADPRVLAEIRRTVRVWLGAIDIDTHLCDDLVYATSEAASNAVEHAYLSPDAGSTVEVTLWSEQGTVNVEIADRGSWLPVRPYPTNRGHGLHLMRGLIESVGIESGADGTTVTLRHPVPHLCAPRPELTCG